MLPPPNKNLLLIQKINFKKPTQTQVQPNVTNLIQLELITKVKQPCISTSFLNCSFTILYCVKQVLYFISTIYCMGNYFYEDTNVLLKIYQINCSNLSFICQTAQHSLYVYIYNPYNLFAYAGPKYHHYNHIFLN